MKPLPRTTPEQRSRFYGDVETLLMNGFLTHPVVLDDTSLSLRSLGPGDIFTLQARVPRGANSEWQIWTIASSVWMLNGYILLDESHAVPRIAESLRRLPRSTRELLFSLVMGLFARQNKAIDAVEPYCYESLSRYKWKSMRGHLATEHSGIPGIQHIGTNHIQRMWAFFNDIEDQRVQDLSMWHGFKLTASAMSPKGVKKIDQKDHQRQEQEEQRRQGVQDRFYYTMLGVLQQDGRRVQSNDSPYVTGPKSVVELEEEMRRWVAGEEDWHDKVVSNYKRQISQRYQQQKREQGARAAMVRAQLETESGRPMPLVGYTAEQLAEILRQRQPGKSGVREVFDGGHGDRDYLYEKYLETTPDAGVLRVTDGKLLTDEGNTLTEQVAQRAVPFHVGPGDEE